MSFTTPNNWKTLKLHQITEPSRKQWKVGDGVFDYIGLEHINQNDLSLNGKGTSETLESNKFVFKKGDVLFGKLRPYFRKVVRINFDGVCSTDIWVFRAKEGIDQGFLFYFLANQRFVDAASGGSSGTRMPRADWDYLKNTEWSIPPLEEQRSIAAMLGSLDDKIELLRAQNKTLEAMAQTLFKEWFVDFRFPSSTGVMVDSELGEIPEGWRVGKLGDVGSIVCGKTPSKANPEFFGGQIPFIKIPDMHGQMFIVKTEDSLTSIGADTQKNKYIPKNSICVSCIATVGLVSITTQDSQTNQQINSVVPNTENMLEYLYFVLKEMSGDLQMIGGGGSATLNVNTGVFSNIEIKIPDDKILNSFHEIVFSGFEKIKLNVLEIQTLSKLRNELLNKLFSN